MQYSLLSLFDINHFGTKNLYQDSEIKVISMFMVKAVSMLQLQTNMKFCLMLLSEFKKPWAYYAYIVFSHEA